MLLVFRLPLLVAFLFILSSANALAQAKVVTSIKPLQLIAAAITDGVSTPSALIPDNQSPHHFSLRPSDVRRMLEADVLIWVGPGLETYLARAVTQSAQNAQVIETAQLEEMFLLDLQEADHSHAHAHDDNHPYDPHLWLNTDNALLIAQSLLEALVAKDSANAHIYRDNFARFESDILALSLQLRDQFLPLQGSQYAVYHNGTQYLEQQLGLAHLFVLAPDHEQQPGIRHLLSVREQVEALQPHCLLTDINANDATINTVFQNREIRQASLDTLGASIEVSRDAYQRLIQGLSQSVYQCLSPQ